MAFSDEQVKTALKTKESIERETEGEPFEPSSASDPLHHQDIEKTVRNQGRRMTTFNEIVHRLPWRTRGIILTAAGIVTCLVGILLSSNDWAPHLGLIGSIGQMEIEILEGRQVLVNPSAEFSWDRYETRGRWAIPLRYVLVIGVLISAVGVTMLAIQRPPSRTHIDEKT